MYLLVPQSVNYQPIWLEFSMQKIRGAMKLRSFYFGTLYLLHVEAPLSVSPEPLRLSNHVDENSFVLFTTLCTSGSS